MTHIEPAETLHEVLSNVEKQKDLLANINSKLGRYPYARQLPLKNLKDWKIVIHSTDDDFELYFEGFKIASGPSGGTFELFQLLAEEYQKRILTLTNYRDADALKKKIDHIYTREQFSFQIRVKDHGKPSSIHYEIFHEGDKKYYFANQIANQDGSIYEADHKVIRYWGEDFLNVSAWKKIN